MAKKKMATARLSRKAPAAMAAAAPAPVAGVTLVNMIPRSLSKETNQDSEPSISVNPANPVQIEGTAFTPDPMRGPRAPIFVSIDGGITWTLNSIVPSSAGTSPTHDISLGFASAGGNLYGGILRHPTGNFEILRTTAFMDPTPMQILASR